MHIPNLPFRELTYPTTGKGTSSWKVPLEKDMLVSWRVFVESDMEFSRTHLHSGDGYHRKHWENKRNIPVLCEPFSCVKISMYDPEWPTMDRPISWYWTFFVASKNIHHRWWQPTRRCWLNSWLGDKVMSLALFVLGIDVDSHTLPRSLSLSPWNRTCNSCSCICNLCPKVYVWILQHIYYIYMYDMICYAMLCYDMIWYDMNKSSKHIPWL